MPFQLRQRSGRPEIEPTPSARTSMIAACPTRSQFYDRPHRTSTTPSRTCWTRRGALPFHFSTRRNRRATGRRNSHAQQWRGAIIGPHGSGKSTLLESLKPVIIATGRQVISDLASRRPAPPASRYFASASGRNSCNSVIIVDGYEQLGWPSLGLWLRCRHRAGLLSDLPQAHRIPTLIHLSPDASLNRRHLVAKFCAEVSTTITRADIAASHACHGSNVARDLLRSLRSPRTEPPRRTNCSCRIPRTENAIPCRLARRLGARNRSIRLPASHRVAFSQHCDRTVVNRATFAAPRRVCCG